MKKDYIVIPARFNSKRLPGKPLILIKDIPLIDRVISVGVQVQKVLDDIELIVATDDELIKEHCSKIGIKCVMTDGQISSGTERVFYSLNQIGINPDLVINLQGDAPFISAKQIIQTIESARKFKAEVTTPVFNLSWVDLDALNERKKLTPYSGTTCIIDKDGYALWFSKQIIPSMRKEDDLRKHSLMSPVFQHLGLYCYSFECLKWFCDMPKSRYEDYEELEQLRFLENGIKILTEVCDSPIFPISGIDSPNDVIVANKLIEDICDPYIPWR
jgi:3-deoxy-manno-octulosonate cytidylyltransferase (CMP-KDO synthetase)